MLIRDKLIKIQRRNDTYIIYYFLKLGSIIYNICKIDICIIFLPVINLNQFPTIQYIIQLDKCQTYVFTIIIYYFNIFMYQFQLNIIVRFVF